MALTLCAGCTRHIRNAERRCPFCGSEREATAEPAALDGTLRLSRAALMVGTALALGACTSTAAAYGGPPNSGSESVQRPVYDAAADDDATANAVAIYGAPAPKSE